MYRILLIFLIAVFSIAANAQLIDDFSDGDFTSNPTWVGDTGDWQIVTSSAAAGGATNSFTLKLSSATTPVEHFISTQYSGNWGSEQSWGFWMGRYAQAATTANQSIVWLYASESNVTSGTVNGYRIQLGDNSAGDEINLQRVDNGVATTILTSSGSLPNGILRYGIAVRVTRTSASEWTLYTSVLPTANDGGVPASTIPSVANTPVNQGTVTDGTYTDFSNGYFAFSAIHSTGASAIVAAEYDNLFFTTQADAHLPVELTSFTAAPVQDAVKISWQTAAELDNLGFILERAESADGPFSEIAGYESDEYLRGALNSSTEQNYSYTDELVYRNITYWYKLIDVDVNGVRTEHAPVSVTLPVLSEEPEVLSATPGSYALGNYPNPFNPTTTVFFDISAERDPLVATSVIIYDMLGKQVRTLYQGDLQPARYAFRWDARNDRGEVLPAGMYIYRMKTERMVITKKMVLIK
jgi:hypothetical protein